MVNGTLTIRDKGTGGKITGGWNTGDGGGVYVAKDATFNLSGGVQIESNTNKANNPSNVTLEGSETCINITGTLSNEKPIGVSYTDDITGYRVFTTALPTRGTYERFTSEEGDGYAVMPVRRA